VSPSISSLKSADSFKVFFIPALALAVPPLLIAGAAFIIGERIHFIAEKCLTLLEDYPPPVLRSSSVSASTSSLGSV